MSWKDLLSVSREFVAPWYGDDIVLAPPEARGGAFTPLKIRNELKTAPYYGWHRWTALGGRAARWQAAIEDDYEASFAYVANGGVRRLHGYAYGDVLYPVDSDSRASVRLALPAATRQFSKIAAFVVDGVCKRSYFVHPIPCAPSEAEVLVRQAFEDGLDEIPKTVKNVEPALAAVFRYAVQQRQVVARRRAEAERQAKLAELRKAVGTAEGRRALAQTDIEGACRAALTLANARLLSVRSTSRTEYEVRYVCEDRRLACLVNEDLAIIDAGICLTSHGDDGFDYGEKGDRMLTLESLPSVVREAVRGNKLVIYRHG